MNKKMKKDLAAFVRNNIEDYEERLQLALKRMDRMRCPLRMADDGLYGEIESAIEDWCEDNDYDVDKIYEDWDDLVEGYDGIIWEE